MVRSLRLHFPGACYHVTLRGNHKQDIFFRHADRELMQNLIAEALNKCNARIHAYCFMTNHLHALIQVADVPLGSVILRIAGPYARIVQTRFATTGHLFEKRYHSVLVDTDAYLLELLRYLHLNPVRAKIVESADEWYWSSHHAYCGVPRDPWLTTDFALRLFGEERGRSIARYRAFVREGEDNPEIESPFSECASSDPRILGSDDFAKKLLGLEWKPRSRKSIDDLINDACRRFLVTVQMLESPLRNSKLVEARAWIAVQAMEGRVASITAVAKRLNRDESSLRHAIKTKFPMT